VRSSLQRGNPEIVLRLDRDKMSALGLDSGVVAQILTNKVQGDVPTRFAVRDRKIDMRVALDRSEFDRVQRLLEVNVNPKGSPTIPLESIAEATILEGPSEIRRLGNTRGAEVQAAVQGFDLGSAQAAVEAAIAAIPTPAGIEIRMGSQKDEMARSMDSVYLALALAIFLVYVVMASQFESLIQPFVILCSLPLAFVGVIFVLLVLDVPLSVIALLGGIVLAGIVVNNAIILVDQINKLRAEGLPKREAILEGARSRLRPVLMTTTTTVLGLLPLTGWLSGFPLLGGSEGVELRAPLAITVVAGLISSTILTLVVIPCVYSMSDRRA
jgi:HAE1 family hydrophobic/amphiphilic exporter-1